MEKLDRDVAFNIASNNGIEGTEAVIGRKRTTLSSIKKIRITANMPAGDNASDISSFIGVECDVIRQSKAQCI